MDANYMPLVSALVGAVIGAGSGIIAVWLQARQWFRQQRWVHREKYYLDLLTSLSQLMVSLDDRCEYFIEPGSEHDEHLIKNERFQALVQEGQEAIESIKRQQGVVALFLSPAAVEAIDALLRDLWHAANESICTADFTQSALDLANTAHSVVLREAKGHIEGA